MSIFLDNKYTKIYNKIVARGKARKIIEGFGEKHHIIPESFFINRQRNGPAGWLPGNPDANENLVYLTLREHYICHVLLVKMTDGLARKKSAYALNVFTSAFKSKKHNRYNPSSRMYELARKLVAEEKSKIMMGNSLGKNRSEESIQKQKDSRKRSGIPAWNKGKKLSDEHCEKISRSVTGKNNPMYGKNHTHDTKKKQSEAKLGKSNNKLKGITKTLDHRKALSISLVGKNPKTDHTKYSFVHESGIIEFCTKVELVKKYNLNAGAIYGLVHQIKNRKSHKGWRLNTD